MYKTNGQIAYEAYCDKREWKSFDGKTLPKWDEVKIEIKEAWEYAAIEVIRNYFKPYHKL